jgi:hypothetical protein
MWVSLSRHPPVPQYLGLIIQPIVFAMHFANPKYWSTWQLRISYRLEENNMADHQLKYGLQRDSRITCIEKQLATIRAKFM